MKNTRDAENIRSELAAAIGARNVLAGRDAEPWSRDWTGRYRFTPLAVARPGTTGEVARVVRLAAERRIPVVPVGGNTGLAGGTWGEGGIMLSLDRMNRIREIRPQARIAIVEAGVVLDRLHEAAAEHDLNFPMTFGARGSAMIGGLLATNAGGSNVLRYGNTRNLCLGLEVVLPSGEVMDILSELHKDNSGYDLRDLLIGSEGTLGVITAAVLKLVPRPSAYATAMVATPTLKDALALLNRLQIETGGAVEAFEYMPRAYIERHLAHVPGAREPFDAPHDVNILLELGATAPRDAMPGPDGRVPIVARLEDILAELLEEGAIIDAVVAQSEAQRRAMWKRREEAAEITFDGSPLVLADIALPLDRVEEFLGRMTCRLKELDPGAHELVVSHLGDGNVHYTAYLTRDDTELAEAVTEAIEDEVIAFRGSFSAEHGVGRAKLGSMRRRKNPQALATMRAIKQALDPLDILNPGKVIP